MLDDMDTQAYETKRLDHLGIVAGICQRINLIELIDSQLPSPSDRKVSCGQATQAMVLNALGLSGRALYLMPEYMRNKPIDILIGEGLEADDFNDDALGRALDELQQAGVTGLFASIAAEAVNIYGIETEYVHLDSSSFSLQGQYDSDYAQRMTKTYEAVKIKRGYSKDKRPDLKQVVVNLITSQASALPLWLEVLDGNSSDPTTFRETVTAYCDELVAEGEKPPRFIFDAAGYTEQNLTTWFQLEWVTRVPETLTAAKETISAVSTEMMEPLDDNYRAYPLCTWYAEVKQRWLLIYSQKAFEREQQKLCRQIDKQQKQIKRDWKKLCKQPFHCILDAGDALQTFTEQLNWWQTKATVVPIKKYSRPGRPSKEDIPEIAGWRIQGTLVVDELAVAEASQWYGRFILATNILDEQDLSDQALLARYKEQSSSVERGFRFLKDPMFFADSLFLKSPVRIMAMTMVMGLALLVYALAERELRVALKAKNETLPSQTGSPTQKITMRRVAQIFEGVDLLIIRSGTRIVSRQILNLSPVRLKILKLFDPTIQYCYFLNS